MTHRTLTRRLALITSAAAILVPAIGYETANASTGAIQSHCAEDNACWNWVTMGNHKRGVVTLWGNQKVVGACGFQRLMRQGRIAYTVTVGGETYKTLDRLKGDRTALKRNCA